MRNNTKTSQPNQQIESALLHEMWYVDGRAEALKHAWDCRDDLDRLRAEVQEVEENIHNPHPALKDRMAPGASTRVYQDGYLAGLKEAIEIITNETVEKQKQPVKQGA
ncbi:MAG: hypothetical protein WCD37_09595 [Chloroflexia bacterium]